MSVIEKPGYLPPFLKTKQELNKVVLEQVRAREDEINAWLEKSGCALDAAVEIQTGVEFIQVITTVMKGDYDLVVKCSENVEWLDRLFGSDDMHLLRKCPCPVLLLNPLHRKAFKNVLATVDVAEDDSNQIDNNRVQNQLNKAVLEYSLLFAVPEASNLFVGSVWYPFYESYLTNGVFARTPETEVNRYVDETYQKNSSNLHLLLSEMRSSLGELAVDYIDPQVHLKKGLASQEIPNMVKEHDIDLLVMGTVARTGIPGLIIGNTAENILEQVQCSVLAIKPEGFQSPVVVKGQA